MKLETNILSLLATISVFTAVITAQECKTVTTVEPFDINEYASAPWYVQQQAEILYLPIEQNYCVRAQYTVFDQPTFLFGYTVGVNNLAQDEQGREYGGDLCAYQTNASPSKLAVAPCFLPKLFAGPYWVVAYNETEGYALISGGQPTIPSEDGSGCTTGTGINNSGLWIFTRQRERDEALVQKVRDIATDAGFDLSVLNDVDQTNCDDDCADSTGSLDGKTCAWVAENPFVRCVLSDPDSGIAAATACPVTCGTCP